MKDAGDLNKRAAQKTAQGLTERQGTLFSANYEFRPAGRPRPPHSVSDFLRTSSYGSMSAKMLFSVVLTETSALR